MILSHVVLFLAASAVADALLAVFTIATGIRLGPTPIVSVLIHYGIAFVLVFRLAFTTFQLPNRTPIPLSRGFDWWADAKLLLCLAAAVGIVGSIATFLVRDVAKSPLVQGIIVLAVPIYMFSLTYGFLGVLRLLRRHLPSPPDDRPPIEVIIPAYNEELNIGRLLESIDDAAVRYDAPVRVILCDDGSVDQTRLVARDAMEHFQAASGQIIEGRHGGKSAALNQALQECQSDFVFRVDADCVVDEWCFVYALAWFVSDPRVGLVGAFTLPKEPYTSWIDRMRLFELLFAFGFTRVCSAEIDGVPCVPGTFTGFRRLPALEIGGFVEGMYGEDVDFTCNIARLGYTAAIDRRVVSYEDVPNRVRQLRIQRTRWNRGGTMSFARFTPFGLGLAGPRFWFTTNRAAGKRLMSPLHLAALLFATALAIFHPSSHHNLARVAFVLLAAQIPNVLMKVMVGVYYKKARYLPWLSLWWAFAILKRLFALEAFLSFNTRPVQLSPALRAEWQGRQAKRQLGRIAVLEDIK